MGLDSVELILEIEKYFKIRIPDAEAEAARTMQDVVDIVAKHLNITSHDTLLRDRIFEHITRQLNAENFDNKITLNDKVADYLSSEDKHQWADFESKLSFKVPRPEKYKPSSNKYVEKFLRKAAWRPTYEWNDISFEQFTNAVCAHNYHALLDRDNLTNIYEIYIAIMGITGDRMGVDYYEMGPDKRFVHDFGID